ncbi:ankyrin repeat domain-containing protein 17-like isoform X2 [Haliotis rufescens]|uniref:ankyrin repeat domain-containing protein 17-like isoform X2 n=1 Tax=Haliotis rufescens TaxID=6454 RepID=UPI00201FA228|nr:ankyrin repeat domain-containing protein 17-like isoform X2 [Haliotis rufescens]
MHAEDMSHPHPKRMKKALSDPSQDPSRSEGISTVTPSQACTDHGLYDASGRGDQEEVRLILATGLVNINCPVGLGRRTPMMAAAWSGHREVVELLVSKGADVSLVDGGGNNSLHYACCGGDAETVKSVLSPNVVDIDGRGWRRRTPMMEAADRGHREVVELLVSKGANVSLVDGGGNNSLHYACCGGDVETVKYVLSLNVVDIDGRGEVSRTPVMCAARWRNREVVEFLVSKGANVSLVDKIGNNILHLASGEGDVETVKFVVSLNVVDINARNNIGLTAADRARDWARRQLLDLLVSHGAQ